MRLFGRFMTLRDLPTSLIGLIGLAIVVLGGYRLWTAHQEHLADILVFLPLAACLLLHLFMHRGHGHSQGDHGRSVAHRRDVSEPEADDTDRPRS